MRSRSDAQHGTTPERQHVWIELDYGVRELSLTGPSRYYEVEYPLRASYSGSHAALVEVAPAETSSGGRDDGVATARLELSASERIAHMLRELSEGRVPVGTKVPTEDSHFPADPLFDPETRVIRENYSVPLDLLPEVLQSFVAQAVGEARDYLVRTVQVMRWRQAAPGPHSPFSHRGQRFSLDGETWHHLPSSMRVDVWSHGSLSFRGSEWQEVVDLVAGGVDEPFSFALHREAWNQRHANPRSALLLGIAAAEIGFKECVAALVPDAEWLVREAPSPPLTRMLTEYLPNLPAKNRIAGKVVPPPRDHLELVKKGVLRRNELAHRGQVTPSGVELRSLLEAIEEILWLLAFYSGSSWARRHISLETRVALGDELSPAEQNRLAERANS